jgi:hypothetical protein
MEPMMNANRKRLMFDLTVWVTTPLLAFALLAADLAAKSPRPAGDNPIGRAECGGCHPAYPPALLPAAEGRHPIGSLDRHFGVAVSVAPGVARGIERHLVAGAADGQFDERAVPTPCKR